MDSVTKAARKSAMTTLQPAAAVPGAEIPSHNGGHRPPAAIAPFYVRYRNAVYDLRHFVHKHPGGRSTLHGLQGRDMEQRLRAAPPHSAAAMYLLREYRVDAAATAADVDVNNNEQKPTGEWEAQTDDSMEV